MRFLAPSPLLESVNDPYPLTSRLQNNEFGPLMRVCLADGTCAVDVEIKPGTESWGGPVSLPGVLVRWETGR